VCMTVIYESILYVTIHTRTSLLATSSECIKYTVFKETVHNFYVQAYNYVLIHTRTSF